MGDYIQARLLEAFPWPEVQVYVELRPRNKSLSYVVLDHRTQYGEELPIGDSLFDEPGAVNRICGIFRPLIPAVIKRIKEKR